MIATLTSKGQITVPKAVRDFLHLRNGDRIDFRVSEDGKVELVPLQKSIDSAFGILKDKIDKKLSVEDMNLIIKNKFKK
jgi:AbrB family looped-hinge helix DNA binding protein